MATMPRSTFDMRAPSRPDAGAAAAVLGRDAASASCNGRAAIIGAPGSYVEIAREWRHGDRVDMLPKALRLSRLPDNPKKAAVMWGPMVLAGDLGPAPRNRNDGDGDGETGHECRRAGSRRVGRL